MAATAALTALGAVGIVGVVGALAAEGWSSLSMSHVPPWRTSV